LGIAANLTLGICYAGSVISKPLLEMVNVPEEEMRAHWATLFSLGIVLVPLGMIVAGWMTDRRGPRISIALGAVIFSSALFLASIATSYLFLCLTIGIMISIGTGFVYGPVVATAVRWFPDRRGLASGLAVGAMGFGPVWMAPVCGIMLNYGFDITAVLQCLGVVAFIAIGTAALFVTSPPSAYQIDIKSKDNKSRNEPQCNDGKQPPTARELNWSGMMRTTDFWILFFFFVLGTIPGLMLLSQAQGIFVSLGDFEAVTASFLVAVLAVANAGGRPLWGAISDYLGRINTLTIMFLCTAVTMFALPFAANPALLASVVIVIGIVYGG
jgi:OFA family oxalate/formate antiporter-like MFS transporter